MQVNQLNNNNNQLNDNFSQSKLIEKVAKTQEVTMSTMLHEKNGDRGTAIVANALSSFSKSSLGKVNDKKIIKKMEQDFKELGIEKEENNEQLFGDKIKKITRKQNVNLHNNEKPEIKADKETKENVKQFSKMYASMIVSGSDKLKEELDKMEQKLLRKGISQDQLLEIKLSIKMSVRTDLMEQIKKAYMQRTVSTDMIIEWGIAEKGLNDLLDHIWNSQQLGGEDFGGFNTDLQGTTDRAMEEANAELRLYLTEILKQKMTERLVSKEIVPEKVREELKGLLEIAGRIGLSVDDFMKKWYQDKIDQGLFIFNAPQAASLMGEQSNQDNQPDQQQSETENNEEYLLNRLRALYLRKALKGDWLTSINTEFKIRKTKNGMKRLGIYSNDVNDKVKEEARLIACTKIMDMLKESFLERATLFALDGGPAHLMVEEKVKGLLKNGQKLGMEIDELSLNQLRDNANKQVFEISKRELQLTVAALQVDKRPALIHKKEKLLILLRRLQKESEINQDLGIDAEQLRDRVQLSA